MNYNELTDYFYRIVNIEQAILYVQGNRLLFSLKRMDEAELKNHLIVNCGNSDSNNYELREVYEFYHEYLGGKDPSAKQLLAPQFYFNQILDEARGNRPDKGVLENKESFANVEAQLYEAMGPQPSKITPASFSTFFLAERPDGEYNQYHSVDALLPTEIEKCFGSSDKFLLHVFQKVYDAQAPSVAWFIYEKVIKKLIFFLQTPEWQPDLKSYEPLLCYEVNPSKSRYELMYANQEVWKRVIWAKMEERLEYAMRQPH